VAHVRRSLALAVVAALGLAAACTFMPMPVPPTADLAKMVEATLAAQGIVVPTVATEAAPPTLVPVGPTQDLSTPTPVVLLPGSISGALSYPGALIPPLRIVAYRGEGGPTFSVEVPQGSTTYTISDVPPGVYHVVAYVTPSASKGFIVGLPAGYSHAVLCGLWFDCSDHSLVEVTVGSGEAVAGIDPRDWYAPEGTFPPMPD
jgi:hypothetical protein